MMIMIIKKRIKKKNKIIRIAKIRSNLIASLFNRISILGRDLGKNKIKNKEKIKYKQNCRSHLIKINKTYKNWLVFHKILKNKHQNTIRIIKTKL
jgi:hypothetical protein